ncbi:MAG: hypothetical protein JSU04_03415 [Bdellovibrionales bacterium]|nr:hypothetical protein [Bdellovibrionales bacterium]
MSKLNVVFMTILLPLVVGCDGFYRVRKDVEIASIPEKACIEDSIAESFKFASVRNCKIVGVSVWYVAFGFSEMDHQHYRAKIAEHVTADGKRSLEMTSSGLTSPLTNDVYLGVKARFDTLESLLEKKCGVTLKQSVEVEEMNKRISQTPNC